MSGPGAKDKSKVDAKAKADAGSPFSALRGLRDKMKAEEDAAKARGQDPQKAAKKPQNAPLSPPNKLPKRTASSDAEDEESFHRLMSGVVPLSEKAARVTHIDQPTAPRETRAAAVQRVQTETESVHEHLRTLVDAGGGFEVSDDGARVLGRRADAPGDLVKKLSRGQIPIDARIDLQGKTAENARATVDAFLAERRTRGDKCVALVLGEALLRGEVAAWLSQGSASRHVIAFASVSSGASSDESRHEISVHVLLRR